jgi:hypothetical protein
VASSTDAVVLGGLSSRYALIDRGSRAGSLFARCARSSPPAGARWAGEGLRNL